MKLKTFHILPTLLIALFLIGNVATVMAQGNGPKSWVTKNVSPLKDGIDDRYGQVIYNNNPEDDLTYELEVEVEETALFEDETVDVLLNGTPMWTLYIDVDGNGKDTFSVSSFDPAVDTIEVTDSVDSLSTDILDYHLWAKGSGPK